MNQKSKGGKEDLLEDDVVVLAYMDMQRSKILPKFFLPLNSNVFEILVSEDY